MLDLQFSMIVEGLLATTREQFINATDDAPLIAAAMLLRDPDADLVVVYDAGSMLAGIITKTDTVRQIKHCPGYGCMVAASAVMTQTVLYCRPNNLLHDIWLVMKQRHLENVPILDLAFAADRRAQCRRYAGGASRRD